MAAADDRDILIVGGGIAGLALAGLLRDKGMEATVVEQTAEWGRVGWGIGLWGNGLAVLDALGVADDAVSRGSVPDRFEIRGADGTRLASVDLPGDDAFLAVHRADLHAALRGAVPEPWVRMGTTPAVIEQTSDGVTVTLDDGTEDRYNAVVGADGLHSRVRDLQFGDWTVDDREAVVWSFWTPTGTDLGMTDTMVSRWASGTEAFLGGVGDRGLVNIATRMPAGVTPDAPALDRLTTTADALGGRLPAAVAELDADDVFFDRIREVRAEQWHRDRAVLIGDAAHAVHPISGMGAALALEDAYVLAEELAGEAPVPDALAAFERRRRSRVRSVVRMAHLEAALTFTESPLLAKMRDALVRWTPAAEWFLQRQVDRYTSAPLAEL